MLGGYGAGRSVEYLAPQVTCRLPDLRRDMYSPSVNFIQDTIVACYGDSCDKLQQGAWVKMADTRQNRSDHTSEVIGDSILLIGGTDSPTTTELVRVTGESVEGFSLGPGGRREHCSVKISDRSVVIIGGFGTWSKVTEYRGIVGEEVTARELPDLLTGREQHVCGQYRAGETQVMTTLVPHWFLTGPSLDLHSLFLHRCSLWREALTAVTTTILAVPQSWPALRSTSTQVARSGGPRRTCPRHGGVSVV